ncbi:MAG: TatD family hydrolase, partial [Planctomycetota bacterium]
MKLVETHCHLTHGRLRNQLATVLASAGDAGVAVLITAGSSVADSSAAAALADRHDRVYCTAGVHPHEAKEAEADYLRRIGELVSRAGNVAVGEIGLDYHYDFSPRPDQRRVFAELLDLAGGLAKPVVVHTREAFEDTLAILAEARAPGERTVFHSFTGDAGQVRR